MAQIRPLKRDPTTGQVAEVISSDTVYGAAAPSSGSDLTNKTYTDGTFLPLAGGTLTGNLIFSADNSHDIGAVGATRPRTVFVGTSVLAPLFNAGTGFQIGGAAATAGHVLRADGTNYVDAQLAFADTSGTVGLSRGGTNADLSATGGAHSFLAQDASHVVSARAIGTGDVPSGVVTWDLLGNAAGALTLANGTNATTFNQTSAVNWTWANTTAAIHLTSQSSPILKLAGTVYNGSASAGDTWTIQDVVGNTDNGTSTLTFDHTGSSGSAAVRVPLLDIGGTDAGISRLGAASLAIGNGTAGDFSGQLTATILQLGVNHATGSSMTFNPGNQAGSAGTAPSIEFFYKGSGDAVLKINSLGHFDLNLGLDVAGAISTSTFFAATGLFSGTDRAASPPTGSLILRSAAATSPFIQYIIDLATFYWNQGVDTSGNMLFKYSPSDSVFNGTTVFSILASSGAITIGGTDAGISRLGAASLAVGNGTAGDFSGSLKLTTLNNQGGSIVNRVTKAAGYTSTATDYVLSFTATATLVLDSGAAVSGTTYRIKLSAAAVAGSNLVVAPNNGKTIDNQASMTMTVLGDSIDVTYDGSTNWDIF